jgi:hypothetical protein
MDFRAVKETDTVNEYAYRAGLHPENRLRASAG